MFRCKYILVHLHLLQMCKFVSSIRLREQQFSGPWQIIEGSEEDKKCGVGEISL